MLVHVKLFGVLDQLPMALDALLEEAADSPAIIWVAWVGWVGCSKVLGIGFKEHNLSWLKVNLGVVFWQMKLCVAKVEQYSW